MEPALRQERGGGRRIAPFLRAEIERDRRAGPVLASQDGAGRIRIGDDGLAVRGSVFSLGEDGAPVHYPSLQDAPAGREFFIADETGALITAARKHANGVTELLGGKEEDYPQYLRNSLKLAGENVAASAAGIGGKVAGMLGNEQAQGDFEALGNWSEEWRREIEDAMSPGEKMSRERGVSYENSGAVMDLLIQSAPFLLGFKGLSAAGGAIGALMRRGAQGRVAGGVGANVGINTGLVHEEVRRGALENGATPEKAREMADSTGLMTALVSGLTGRLQAGRGGMGGPLAEGFTEVAEELTQEGEVSGTLGRPWSPHEVATAAFIGGLGSEAVLSPIGAGLSELSLELSQYPVGLALNRRARGLKKIHAMAQQGAAATGGAAFDADKNIIKELLDLAKWGGRRDQVMGMTDHEVRVNFGRFFDSDIYEPQQIKGFVLDAAEIVNSGVLNKNVKRAAGGKGAAAGEDIASLAAAGNTSAQAFLKKARGLLGLSDKEYDDQEAASALDFATQGALKEIYRDERAAEIMGEAYPAILKSRPTDYVSAALAIKKLSARQIIEGAEKLARGIERTLQQKSASDAPAIFDDSGPNEVKELKDNPVGALMKRGLLTKKKLAEAFYKEAGFGRWLAGMLNDDAAVDAIEKSQTPPNPEPFKKGIEQAIKVDAAAPAPTTTEGAAPKPKPRTNFTAALKALKTLATEIETYEDAQQKAANWQQQQTGEEVKVETNDWSDNFFVSHFRDGLREGIISVADVPRRWRDAAADAATEQKPTGTPPPEGGAPEGGAAPEGSAAPEWKSDQPQDKSGIEMSDAAKNLEAIELLAMDFLEQAAPEVKPEALAAFEDAYQKSLDKKAADGQKRDTYMSQMHALWDGLQPLAKLLGVKTDYLRSLARQQYQEKGLAFVEVFRKSPLKGQELANAVAAAEATIGEYIKRHFALDQKHADDKKAAKYFLGAETQEEIQPDVSQETMKVADQKALAESLTSVARMVLVEHKNLTMKNIKALPDAKKVLAALLGIFPRLRLGLV